MAYVQQFHRMTHAHGTVAGNEMLGRVRPSVDSRDPIVWLISIFVVLDFVYAITFNLLPDGIRLQFIGILFLGQGGLGLISLAMRLDAFRLRLAFGVFLMLAVVMHGNAGRLIARDCRFAGSKLHDGVYIDGKNGKLKKLQEPLVFERCEFVDNTGWGLIAKRTRADIILKDTFFAKNGAGDWESGTDHRGEIRVV